MKYLCLYYVYMLCEWNPVALFTKMKDTKVHRDTIIVQEDYAQVIRHFAGEGTSPSKWGRGVMRTRRECLAHASLGVNVEMGKREEGSFVGEYMKLVVVMIETNKDICMND